MISHAGKAEDVPLPLKVADGISSLIGAEIEVKGIGSLSSEQKIVAGPAGQRIPTVATVENVRRAANDFELIIPVASIKET